MAGIIGLGANQGLPFGTALRDLEPGEYLCNAKILDVLASREIDFELPSSPNFEDRLERYHLDEDRFEAGVQVEKVEQPGTFAGYRRPGKRGTSNVGVLRGGEATNQVTDHVYVKGESSSHDAAFGFECGDSGNGDAVCHGRHWHLHYQCLQHGFGQFI